MALPIGTNPHHLPTPSAATVGEGFATGSISLGGIVVRQVWSFDKVWAVHKGGPDNKGIVSQPWLDYYREWGPKMDYGIDREIQKVATALPGKLRAMFEVMRSLPKEVLGEEGPTGPGKEQLGW